MENRSQYRPMLGLAFFFAAIIKVIFSVFAFLSFSPNIQEVISNSLPMGVIRTPCQHVFNFERSFFISFLVISIIQTKKMNRRVSVRRLLFTQNTSYCLVCWHSSCNKRSYAPSSNFNPTFCALYGFYFKFNRISDNVYLYRLITIIFSTF